MIHFLHARGIAYEKERRNRLLRFRKKRKNPERPLPERPGKLSTHHLAADISFENHVGRFRNKLKIGRTPDRTHAVDVPLEKVEKFRAALALPILDIFDGRTVAAAHELGQIDRIYLLYH